MLPRVSNYAYLGVNFASNGAWDSHVKDVCVNGRKKLNQLHSVLSNRDINSCARRLLLLSVVRPSIEYGSEVWDCNKNQASALYWMELKRSLAVHLKPGDRYPIVCSR